MSLDCRRLFQSPGRFETAHRIAGASVVYADYGLIRRRYFSDGADPQESRIDEWLLWNAALMSEAQTAPNAVNGKISTRKPSRRVFRPRLYGRAFVVPAVSSAECRIKGRGLFDLKGVGLAKGQIPEPREHRDGLEYLATALTDLVMQKIVEEIFQRSGAPFACVPVYALISTGFDYLTGWRGVGPAGIHVRAGHARPPDGNDLPQSGSDSSRARLTAELLLRQYGITSAGGSSAIEISRADDGRLQLTSAGVPHGALEPREEALYGMILDDYGQSRIDGVNVQLAESIEKPGDWMVFDFGHYIFRDRFGSVLANLARDRFHRLDRLLFPKDAGFVQPHPQLNMADIYPGKKVLEDRCFAFVDRHRGAPKPKDTAAFIDRELAPVLNLFDGFTGPSS